MLFHNFNVSKMGCLYYKSTRTAARHYVTAGVSCALFPLKAERLKREFAVDLSWSDEGESAEGVDVRRGVKGVHPDAGREGASVAEICRNARIGQSA